VRPCTKMLREFLNKMVSHNLYLPYSVVLILCKLIQVVVVGLQVLACLSRIDLSLSWVKNLSAEFLASNCYYDSESTLVDSWEMSLWGFLVFDSVPMLYLSTQPMSVS